NWQRELWNRVFRADRSVGSRWLADRRRRWMMLPDAMAAVPDAQLKKALDCPIHIFGPGYVGPGYAKILARLGTLTDVHIYALNPCMEFWEDIDPFTDLQRRKIVAIKRREKSDALDREGDDPFRLDATWDNSALRLWARPGREYVRILNELADCDFTSYFVRPAGGARASILERLQDDILTRAGGPSAPSDLKADADDRSIRFLACPTVVREAEIAANAIWSLMHEPANEKLRFHQVAAIFPDRLESEYLTAIKGAFERLHQIPVDVVNQPLISESRVAEAISLLLELPLGRFTRDEVLRVLTHPAIAGPDPENDVARWPEWSRALGVFFGADEGDLEGTYVPHDLVHWDQALKRLALGVFMAGETSGFDRFFLDRNGSAYLPYELGQDDVQAVAAMLRLARAIIADAREIRSARLRLGEWAQVLGSFVRSHVRPDDASGERIRDFMASTIENMAIPGIADTPMPYSVAREYVHSLIGERESNRGRLMERGVAIGTLAALRSIPFQVIFVLGMNEGDFPDSSRLDSLDLRGAQRKAGDVSRDERDRYLFLEAILAARERLFVSYVSHNAQTGEKREPSTVVHELQFVLRSYCAAQALRDMTIEHPASRYDLRYFLELPSANGDDKVALQSFDTQARRAARMKALRSDLARHCGGLTLPGRDEPILEKIDVRHRSHISGALSLTELPPPKPGTDGEEFSVSISALRRFLECPIQGAARYALGLEEDDEAADIGIEDEPMAQSVLGRTILLREVLWKSDCDPKSARKIYQREAGIATAHGDRPSGVFAETTAQADQERLQTWIEHLRKAKFTQSRPVRLGSADRFEDRAEVLPDIRIEFESRRSDGSIVRRRARLYGSLGNLSLDYRAAAQAALSKKPKTRYFLEAYFAAIALAAGGKRHGTFEALVLTSNGAFKKKFDTPSTENARKYLATLVSDLFSGRNHYFMPVEAIAEIWSKIGKKTADDLIDVLENLREDEFWPCSSSYGPARDARRFEPPPAGEIEAIVKRRFGPIASIFDDSEEIG
ncbi:MAG TPA: exodeoxyribonuclease V subunit gamma, partial [Candidatus Binataceae bacterium]|nr:exodeoxyribonuclease V subunit gamma [Candidatus Binataceae bacterium]